MLSYQSEFGLAIKVREATKYAINYDNVLEYSTSISEKLHLYNATVTISFVDLVKCGDWGNVTDLGSRKYWIYVHHDLDSYSIAETLAHELVHVNQLTTGMLRLYQNGSAIWKNVKYNVVGNTDLMSSKFGTIEYLEKPWEIDADTRATQLVNAVEFNFW